MLIPPASNWWKPPIPALFIHSMSFLIPSLETFPSIQCHQTCGLELLGGVWNILANSDESAWTLNEYVSVESVSLLVGMSCRSSDVLVFGTVSITGDN